MGTTDIFLLVIIVVSLIIGFFWGAARSLLLLGAWLAAFVVGAYLKLQVGAWLARQWTHFDPGFNEMAAYAILFVGALLIAPVAIVVGTSGDQSVSRYQALDDAVSAGFAGFVALLGIAGVMIVLSTYYAERSFAEIAAPEWVTSLEASLADSTIGSAIKERLVPLIGAVLGPLLPRDVREVMT